MITIATATTCSCGEPVLLTELLPGARHRYQAHCERCVFPNEATGPSYIVGVGDEPQQALWAWQDSHDEAYAATLKVTPAGREFSCVVDVWRQAKDEAKRQAGWFRRVHEGPEGRSIVWAPNRFDTPQAAEA